MKLMKNVAKRDHSATRSPAKPPLAERRGRAEFQDEDRHRDREDPVDEGLETVLGQSVDVRAQRSVTPGRRFRSTLGPTSADGIHRTGQKAIAGAAAQLPRERSSPA